MFQPPGVRQGSPGRKLCFRVYRVRSVNQTLPSPPSPCLRTMREDVGLTLLTATLCHLSSSAPSWSELGENNILFIYLSVLFGRPPHSSASRVSVSDAQSVCGRDHG